MKKYIVTLKNFEDLEEFYNDMETPGGSLYIPDRAVDLIARRPISRNTHYWLTDEEAELIRKDERVLGVELDPMELGIEYVPFWTQTGNFEKSSTITSTDKNWGLYRCILGNSVNNWGTNGNFTETTQTISTIGSGKNVDVVVVDSHLKFDHPEFAVNADGTGGTRTNQLNWFQYSSELGYNTSGSYDYSYIKDTHGTHVAGTVSGNTQGWARDSKIYSIEFNYQGNNFSGGENVSWGMALWDYIRTFHRKKPINLSTGKRNPTITNHSYGTVIGTPLWINNTQSYSSTLDSALGLSNSTRFHSISEITYRGTTTTYTSPSDFNSAALSVLQDKVASLRERGIPVIVPDFGLGDLGNNFFAFVQQQPFLSGAAAADIIDAIKEGVVVVSAAGNSSYHIDISSGLDYNNVIVFKDNNTLIGLNPHRGSSPSAVPGVICVGNIGTKTQEYKSTSSNHGPRLDIWAPGTNIISSVYSNAAVSGITTSEINGYSPVADPRNSSFYIGRASGTSMASPQVCGILACMAENWVRGTQVDAYRYLFEFSRYDQVGNTGGNYADNESLNPSSQTINNRFLYYDSYRDASGFMSFKSATYTQRIIPTDVAILAQQLLNLSTTPTQPLKYPRKNTLVFKGS